MILKTESKFYTRLINRFAKQEVLPVIAKAPESSTKSAGFSEGIKPENFRQFAVSLKTVRSGKSELRRKIEETVKNFSKGYEFNSRSALGKCTSWPSQFKRELENKITEKDVQICRVRSKNVDSNDIKHFYLSVFSSKDNKELFIIDPTISQFIQGYDKVFIGTRKELKKLIFSLDTEIINASWAESWRKFPREYRNKSVSERGKVQKLVFYKEAFGQVPLQLS